MAFRRLAERDVLHQVMSIVEEPFQSIAETGQVRQQVFVQDLDRDQGQQSDQRFHPHRMGLAIDLKLVVVEAIFLVPQPATLTAVHGVDDTDEVIQEFRRHVGIRSIVASELESHRHHRAAVERHPSGAVGLFQFSSFGQTFAAVEDADVVQSQEPASENVVAVAVDLVHPPCEVHQQTLERL